MENKSFIKLLRKIIREEVQLSVRKEFRTFLKEQKLPDHKKVINHGLNLHDMAENPRKKKTYTKNSMLNKLLNETANTADFSSMKQGPIVSQMESYPTMNNKPYESSTAESFNVQDSQPQTVATPELEAVNKAINRDYSGLMKAMNKKNGKMGTTK